LTCLEGGTGDPDSLKNNRSEAAVRFNELVAMCIPYTWHSLVLNKPILLMDPTKDVHFRIDPYPYDGRFVDIRTRGSKPKGRAPVWFRYDSPQAAIADRAGLDWMDGVDSVDRSICHVSLIGSKAAIPISGLPHHLFTLL
jgi:hypothetical protein